MRPIAINGHERPITKVKFNKDGDLLFTSAKNPVACVWYADDGERLGCFGHVKKGDNDSIASYGHTGAIFDIDVSYDSKQFLTASADEICILWDCTKGSIVSKIKAGNVLRSCGFSQCGNLIFYTTHPSIKKSSYLKVIDTRIASQVSGEDCVSSYSSDLGIEGSICKAEFGLLDNYIVVGTELGFVDLIETTSGKQIIKTRPHSKHITDIQMYKDKTMFITSSKDHAAKLIDSFNLNEFVTYTTERPVNSASISPLQKHVILAGGQEAEDVTTSASSGKFDSRLYHMVYGEEFGNIKGHFGPVNSVQFNPDGTGFVSGGEDGYVRIHIFDPDYYEIDNKIF